MAVVLAPPEEKLITGEELAHMPDVELVELIEGRIAPMTPTGEAHGGYEGNFYSEMRDFVQTRQLGKVRVGEVGIYIRRNPDTIRAADVLYISNDRYAQKQSASFLDVAPELVVEVLSPDDPWSAVTQKLRDYFAAGVQLIWVADPQTRTVYAYRSLTDVREFTETDDLPGDDILPGFAVKVATLFEI